jgi:hypothetical protein
VAHRAAISRTKPSDARRSVLVAYVTDCTSVRMPIVCSVERTEEAADIGFEEESS